MYFDLETSTDLLRRTPHVLVALLEGIDPAFASANEGVDTFSPFDVVGHLIDGEETDWIVRARLILASGPDVRFEPYDRFRHKTRNADRELSTLLADFASLRAANLQELHSWNLDESLLDLPGEHPELGGVTLRQLLSSWVVHDLSHIGQIVRVVAKQYRKAIGPWASYLPIVNDRPEPAS